MNLGLIRPVLGALCVGPVPLGLLQGSARHHHAVVVGSVVPALRGGGVLGRAWGSRGGRAIQPGAAPGDLIAVGRPVGGGSSGSSVVLRLSCVDVVGGRVRYFVAFSVVFRGDEQGKETTRRSYCHVQRERSGAAPVRRLRRQGCQLQISRPSALRSWDAAALDERAMRVNSAAGRRQLTRRHKTKKQRAHAPSSRQQTSSWCKGRRSCWPREPPRAADTPRGSHV